MEHTAPESPRLWRWNPALRASRQQQAGETVYVVQNPATGEHFQLGSDEWRIARAFGEGRSPASVAARLAQEGESWDAGDLETFAAQLGDAGLLLAGDAVADRPRPAERRRGLARWLYIELAAFRPQRFFEVTAPWVAPLMSRRAMTAAGVLVVAASFVLATQFATLRDAVVGSLSGRTLIALWAVYSVVVLIHEMAHGYACVRFGGRVHALGLLFMYGRPCAYCDVSDAWLFPEKSKKIWVMAAGSLLELVLWALATLAWRVFSPETWIHSVALVVMTVCGIGTLFNFNPLLKFDGYYMLSDALEIPNLRERAFRDLGRGLLRREREARTPRERWLFPTYAVFALLYSGLVLGYIGWRLQAWMGSRWGAEGLLLLWGAVGLAVARPVWKSFGDVMSQVRGASRSRRLRFAGGVVLALAALTLIRWPVKVSSECRIEPLRHYIVRAPIAGEVAEVLVFEGARIDSGAALLRLETRELDYDLEAARAEEQELEARVRLLRHGARAEELEMARRKASAAATRRQFARKTWERAQAGLERDLVSREEVEQAERALRLRQEEEREAREALALLEAGPRPEEIAAMRARLDAVRTEVARLSEHRERAILRAPMAGEVLTPHVERLVGERVQPGDSLLVLADLSAVVLHIPVPEKEVGDVELGARVRFKARSHPRRVFEGEVAQIAPVATPGARQRTVEVRSLIDNRDGLLRPGASGFAKIYCGSRPLGAVLARRGVRMVRTEFWALW